MIDYPPQDGDALWAALGRKPKLSPWGLIRELLRRQLPVILVAGLLAVLWFIPGSVGPRLVGLAIDRSAAGWTYPGLLAAAGLLFLAVLVGGFFGTVMGVYTQRNRLIMRFHVDEILVRAATKHDPDEVDQKVRGDIVTGATSDAGTLAGLAGGTAHALGAAVAYVTVTIVVLRASVPLGLLVVIAAPFMYFAVRPLLRPTTRRQAAERAATGRLTAIASDIAAGVRVLRGVGGESSFEDAYRDQSTLTREAGEAAGRWQALIRMSSVLAAGVLLSALAWLGVEMVLAGSLSVGALIALFGYATFLTWPIDTLFGFGQVLVRAQVAAARVARVVRAAHASGASSSSAAPDSETPRKLEARELEVHESGAQAELALGGLTFRRGELTGLVFASVHGADPFVLGLSDDLVVMPAAVSMFSGTLRSTLDPTGTSTRVAAERALWAAAAEDIFEAAPDGWATRVTERAREYSGGQRQRLALARTLLSGAPTVVLEEPTSAVDSVTEDRIAERVARLREGLTTIVITSSPLWLARCQSVVFVYDDGWRAGKHEELRAIPGYGALVRGAVGHG